MKNVRFLVLCFAILCCAGGHSQNKVIDSLNSRLKMAVDDKDRVETLKALSF
jgi:hypothetical protein